MRKHTCHLDHHQRPRYVTIGLEGKFHWVSTVDQQPEGEVVRQSQEEVARRGKFFQPTQPIPKPICDRSGQLDITQDVIGVQTCLSEQNKNVGVEQIHDRSGNLINAVMQYIMRSRCSTPTIELPRERIEENMDFNIPGLPHSTVKQLQSANVRELDLLSVPDHSIKKGADLTGTVTGRSQETKNTTSPITRRSAKRSASRVSTIDLYEMINSAGI